jgi:phasin family protein
LFTVAHGRGGGPKQEILMAKSTATETVDPFGDLSRMIEQFKLPGVDMSAIVESRRKDMDALMAANKATLDSMQELAKKQAEIFAQAMQTAQDSIQSLAKGGVGAPDQVEQVEVARKAYERAVAGMSELAQMAIKAQADAMAIIATRAQQSVEEMKKVVQPK